MTSRHLAFACLLAGLMATGCKRKPAEESAPPPPPPAANKVSLDDGAGAPPPPPPPPVPAAEAPPVADTTGDVSTPEGRFAEQLRTRPPQGDGEMPTQKALIWAIDRFDERYQRAPKDVYELVAKGLLKNPPAPPSGKKYQLDAHNFLLELVDK